jgi:amino acid transporter
VINGGPRAEAIPSHDRAAVGPHPPRRLGAVALVALMYLVVSGGAYALEDAVQLAGARLTLLLCLVVPLTLSLPTALMAAELTALMPLEGGFYYWVREALGPFAAFVEAYLTLLYTATDMAIYPVLIAAYLGFIFPLGTMAQVALGIALVWASGALNILGVRPVGTTSIVLMGAVVAPFAAMVSIGFPRLLHWHLPAPTLHADGLLAALGGGLTVVIWNFSGWENLSVVAGEIENPRRTYARAIAFALPLVALGYLLPLAVSLSGVNSTANWRVGYFVEIGRGIGGAPLAIALAVGGAIAAFSIFDAAMLWVSRMPYVLAREGYLPPRLAEVRVDRATPATSIITCCVVFTMLVPLGFVLLVVLDVFFYMGALMLEMWALVRLRHSRPDRAGLFIIGGGRAALIAVVVAPIVTWMATFGLAVSNHGGAAALIISIVLALGAWPAYAFLRRRYGGPHSPSSLFKKQTEGENVSRET